MVDVLDVREGAKAPVLGLQAAFPGVLSPAARVDWWIIKSLARVADRLGSWGVLQGSVLGLRKEQIEKEFGNESCLQGTQPALSQAYSRWGRPHPHERVELPSTQQLSLARASIASGRHSREGSMVPPGAAKSGPLQEAGEGCGPVNHFQLPPPRSPPRKEGQANVDSNCSDPGMEVCFFIFSMG